MERNNDIFKENNVLISERHRESGDDACQDVEELGRTVELVGLVDEGEEHFVDCLSDHLTAGNQLDTLLSVENRLTFAYSLWRMFFK